MARRTRPRPRAYVDTSALIAYLDRSDTYHPLFRRLFADPPDLLSTALVVGEGQAWFLKRYDRMRALQFVSFFEELRPLQVVEIGHDELLGGAKILRRFSDQDLTMADAVGLHVMKALRVDSCWSTDFHLGLSGVPLVIDQH
jgi:predicted nucleic acid-binding protein